jgi:hypothetical protein
VLRATIRADGRIVYEGELFRSPSTAAKEARKRSGYSGDGDAATNGWKFWHFCGADGIRRPLGALRRSDAG